MVSNNRALLTPAGNPDRANSRANDHQSDQLSMSGEGQEAQAADLPATQVPIHGLRQMLENMKTEQLERLAEKDAEIAELKEKRDRLKRMCDHVCGLLAGLEGRELPKDRVLRSKDATFDAVAPILAEYPGPMHYREIYRHLQERGFEIEGKDPGNSLLARITSDPRIERVGRGFYRLVSSGVAA